MTHLPYIATAYGLTIGLAVILGTGAALRLRRAKARLAAIERPSRAYAPAAPSTDSGVSAS